MRNFYQDPNLKHPETGEPANNPDNQPDSEEDVIDGEDNEWVNSSDLDAVDPDDIALGEEYL